MNGRETASGESPSPDAAEATPRNWELHVSSSSGIPLTLAYLRHTNGSLETLPVENGVVGLGQPEPGIELSAPGHTWKRLPMGQSTLLLDPETLIRVRWPPAFRDLERVEVCPYMANSDEAVKDLTGCSTWGETATDTWAIALDAPRFVQLFASSDVFIRFRLARLRSICVNHDLQEGSGDTFTYDLRDWSPDDRAVAALRISSASSPPEKALVNVSRIFPSDANLFRPEPSYARHFPFGHVYTDWHEWSTTEVSRLPLAISGLPAPGHYRIYAYAPLDHMYSQSLVQLDSDSEVILRFVPSTNIRLTLSPSDDGPPPETCRAQVSVPSTAEGFVRGDSWWNQDFPNLQVLATGEVLLRVPTEAKAIAGGGPLPPYARRFPMPRELELRIQAPGFETLTLPMSLPPEAESFDLGRVQLERAHSQILLTSAGEVDSKSIPSSIRIRRPEDNAELAYEVRTAGPLPDGLFGISLRPSTSTPGAYECWDAAHPGDEGGLPWYPEAQELLVKQGSNSYPFVRNANGSYAPAATTSWHFQVVLPSFEPSEQVEFGWRWRGFETYLSKLPALSIALDPDFLFVGPEEGGTFWWRWIDSAGLVGQTHETPLVAPLESLELSR